MIPFNNLVTPHGQRLYLITFVCFLPLYCRDDEMDEKVCPGGFLAEAMELPMVALQSIKAGAMAHLKGLSCHRQDGRGEWMLAIWKRFQGLKRCRVLPCTWFRLLLES